MAQEPPLDTTGATADPSPVATAAPPASTAPQVSLPVSAEATPASAAPPDGDWASQVVGSIDQYVGLVRDRATRPALVITRAMVFGVIIVILAIAAAVLLWIAWITGITALVDEVWITYLITGGILVLLGAFLMRKRGSAGEQI
jgi:hypothetical protein